MGYTKLFEEIITSSVWSLDDKTRLVWVTILALKNKNGIVKAAIPGLANAARVPLEDCERAIHILESPDQYSRSKDNDGRRIAPIDGGWQVLNHFKYRDLVIDDPEASAARERQRRKRERDKGVTSRDTVSASVSVSALKSEEKEKSIVSPPLPPSSGDEAFWDEIKSLYTWLDLDRERAKMKAWLLTPRGKGRKLTKRFVINWLNKCDKPLETPKPRIVV